MKSENYQAFNTTTARGQSAQIRMYENKTAELFLYANKEWQHPANCYFYTFKDLPTALDYFAKYRRTIHC